MYEEGNFKYKIDDLSFILFLYSLLKYQKYYEVEEIDEEKRGMFDNLKNEENLLFKLKYEKEKEECSEERERSVGGNKKLKNEEKCGLTEKVEKTKESIYDNKNNLLYTINKKFFIDKNIILLDMHTIKHEKNDLEIKIGKEKNFKNNTILEGEFLNNKKWNGIIKIYNNLIIEENKDMINQKLKEKMKKNSIILRFESEFKNGKIIGKRKEYDNDGNLIFEGEFLSWEKNGKGIELFEIVDPILGLDDSKILVDFIKLKYEGDYSEGKITGKGKEYFIIGYIKFDDEQEFLKEKERIMKIGKYYNFDKNCIFNGKYKNGKKWKGKRKEYNYVEELIYEGEYKNGKRNGVGIVFDINKKIIFKGEYINNKKWNGIEYKYEGNIQYEQEYKNGEKNEKIIMKQIFKNKLLFEGECLNGKRNGKGKEYFKNKLMFEGEYKNGKRNGFGIEYNVEDGIFEGEFKNGMKWHGRGYNKSGDIEYEITDGYGIIKEYYNGKLIYEGEYSKGKRNGIGKEFDFLTGKLKYEGKFINGIKTY